jgi:septum formation topological specificity factor MinE
VSVHVVLYVTRFMRLEHYSEEKLKKEILEIVGRHLDLKKYLAVIR